MNCLQDIVSGTTPQIMAGGQWDFMAWRIEEESCEAALDGNTWSTCRVFYVDQTHVMLQYMTLDQRTASLLQ